MNLDPFNLVLWKDDHLLVVDKPAGLPTLVDGYDPGAPYLVGLLRLAYEPLWVVHRLDRDTSGVMVFARATEVHRVLNAQFEGHTVSKIYHSLVTGDPRWTQKTVELPLRPNGDRRHRTVIDAHRGKKALTTLRVLDRFERFTLIEAIPQTGRTHQIRVHLAAQGCPVVADALYGNGRGILLSDLKPGYKGGASDEKPLLERLGLHARSLSLTHPSTGERLYFEAPYPQDFSRVLKQLRRYCTPRTETHKSC